MVRFEVEGGVDPLLLVRLEKGDAVATESNAMVAMDRSLTLKGKTRGGFFGSIARKFLNEETFFQQWVEAEVTRRSDARAESAGRRPHSRRRRSSVLPL